MAHSWQAAIRPLDPSRALFRTHRYQRLEQTHLKMDKVKGEAFNETESETKPVHRRFGCIGIVAWQTSGGVGTDKEAIGLGKSKGRRHAASTNSNGWRGQERRICSKKESSHLLHRRLIFRHRCIDLRDWREIRLAQQSLSAGPNVPLGFVPKSVGI
jgi:hypothetical protein